jgi:hypothetical protein
MSKNIELIALTTALLYSLTLIVVGSNSFAPLGSNGQNGFVNVNAQAAVAAPQNWSPIFLYDFNDNKINDELWTKIQVDGGTVNEQNGRLEVTTPNSPYELSEIGYYGNWSQAGYITNYAFNVNNPNETFEASVNVTELDSVAEVSLMISDQKITTLDPINATNWYRLLKIKDTHYPNQHLAMVESRINGGNVSVRMEEPWTSSTGQLKVVISSGSIYFYENGVLRYMEPYLLPTNTCYISIFTSSMGCFYGTDSFDDFEVHSLITDTPTPTQAPSPSPTQSPIPTLALSCKSTITADNFKVEIDGSLMQDDNPLADQPILLFYSVTNGQSWESLTLVRTQPDGSFIALWKPEVTGYYLVKATFEGTVNLGKTSEIINVALTPDINHNVFTISSNSTITQFSFIAEAKNLTFTAEGVSGTTGYVNLEIPKTVLSDVSNLKIYLDNTKVSFSSQSLTDYWLISFTYSHSSHHITLSLGQSFNETSDATFDLQWAILLATVAAIVGLAIIIVAAYKHR